MLGCWSIRGSAALNIRMAKFHQTNPMHCSWFGGNLRGADCNGGRVGDGQSACVLGTFMSVR
jgi:hypothetical protein